MKLIPRSSDISPGIDGICPGPFPPNGFTVLTDAAYGNGDCFGLYWPIGQEHKLPIVCETYHDEWRIVPAFSSIKKFEEWLEVNDDDPMKMASASKIKTLQQISSVLLGNVFQREGLMTHCHCYSEQQNNCLKSANIG
ncbi:TPR-like repeats-containing protein [Escherichia coli]|nr:TPR-like repeats-containing protein [Escherichia coli]VED44081.1 TPR-like repeats-containing protein [Escherichia coli]